MDFWPREFFEHSFSNNCNVCSYDEVDIFKKIKCQLKLRLRHKHLYGYKCQACTFIRKNKKATQSKQWKE